MLTGTVYVNTSATLTIEPGVTVDFGQYYMQVNGTLNARGQSGSNIVFTTTYYREPRIEFLAGCSGWDEQSGFGCIIENASFGRVYLIVNGSVKINGNIFNGTSNSPLFVTGGSPIITNNLFNLASSGVTVTGGSPVLSYNSLIGGQVQFGISLGSGSTAFISNNNISRCQIGIYSSANVNIQGNMIINSIQGIVNNGPSTVIQNNVIAGNYVGIMGAGNIQSNTIVKNSIGIQASSATVRNNNIYGNSQNSITVTSTNTIDATNNWWGTTDTAAINQTILDSKTSSYGTGTVIFVPFLLQPNPLAPPLPNITLNPIVFVTPPPPTNRPSPSPTLTPIPTPVPTPSPTPKIMPGSPLSLGGSTFAETISQFDIIGLAKLVLIALGIMWVIIILVSVDRKFAKKENKKP